MTNYKECSDSHSLAILLLQDYISRLVERDAYPHCCRIKR